MLGVRNDAELNELLKHVHISHGGVLPWIHPTLLKRKGGLGDSPSGPIGSNVPNPGVSARQTATTVTAGTVGTA